jgi:zinc transport system substrate-binding protein
VLLDGVAEATGDTVDRTLEPGVTERLDLAAITADEMVMVIPVRSRRLVARNPVAGVDTLDQPQVRQCFQRAVDGGDPDRPACLPQLVVDVLRAQAAVLPAEQLDDRLPRAAAAVARRFEGFERITRPCHRRECIVPDVITRIVLIILIATGLLAGCGGTGSSGGKKTVVAAFYPLAYAAERIGGTRYSIDNLTPPGAEPHDLELTPKAVARIESADVVLYLSHGFQPAVSKAVDQAKGTAVDVLQGLPLHTASGQEAGLTADPHVWLDPVLFSQIVRKIGTALHGSPTPLVNDLQKLDREYRAGLQHCQRHEIVTSHAAFGYLAQRYGLKQVAITGLTPESEPSPKQLADVVQTVKRTHATTVFFETLISPRLADTVAREVGAKTAVLDPIEGLTPAEQKAGDNYLSLMRQNLAALRKALACQ